jgi:hypothetical protein
MNAGVLHLVQKNDRRVAENRGIGNQQGTRLAARELRHAALDQYRLAGELVCKGQRAIDQLRGQLRRDRCGWAWVVRNSSTGRSERKVVCWVISAMGLRRIVTKILLEAVHR